MASSLMLAEARRAADAAVAEGRRRGVALGIAVVDDRGDLVFSVSMDGARGYAADVAYGKAGAAALWQASSKGLAGNAAGNTVQQRANSLNGGRLVFASGGVPLRRGEALIGAIGVDGAGADGDDEIAALAAALL